MTILHLIPTLGGGGAERQLVLLAAEQVRRGHHVHVGTGRDGVWREALERTGARLHWIANRGTHDPMIVARIAGLIRASRAAVVHTWLRQMDVCGGMAALALRRPWVLSERSSELAYPDSWKHRLRDRLARRAAAIVSNSQPGDRYWERKVSRRVRRFVIPNAIDVAEVDGVPPVSSEDVPAGVPVVLFAGRLEAEKNLDTLLPALQRVVCAGDAVALLCGVGPALEEVREWVRAAGLEDRIRPLGFRRDLWGLMKSAAVLVSISRFEGHPNCVIEAMACRCPIVASDIPEHRAFLDEGSALLVPVDDATAVAAAIRGVLAEPAAARRRAERARRTVERYTVQGAGRAYEEVYQAVLDGAVGAA